MGLRAAAEAAARKPVRTVLMGHPMFAAGASVGVDMPSHEQPFASQRPKAFSGRPDREAALKQWQGLAEALISLGYDVLVIPADKKCAGAALAGMAAFVDQPFEAGAPVRAVADAIAIRASQPLKDDEPAVRAFERVLRGIGFEPRALEARFGGPSDLVRCADNLVFTPGVEDGSPGGLRRLMPWLGSASVWSSHSAAREPLSAVLGNKPILELRLVDPRFRTGAHALCPIGPGRRILIARVEAFADDARNLILSRKNKVSEYIIPLTERDAAMFAAGAMPVCNAAGEHAVIIPEGVSDELLRRIEATGVRPITVALTDWIKKDRGSVRALVCDLGPVLDDRRSQTPLVQDYRRSIRFRA